MIPILLLSIMSLSFGAVVFALAVYTYLKTRQLEKEISRLYTKIDYTDAMFKDHMKGCHSPNKLKLFLGKHND